MDFKLLGSMLLIVGTSIGAGMLALPIVTAQLGFIGSILLYLIVWLVMTSAAFLSLEANLWLPQNSNLVSMAKVTMGSFGRLIAWIVYLLLLYSLLCAYIAGGSDLLQNLALKIGLRVPLRFAALIFISFFGFVVYMGIKSVDYLNRGLMFIKLGALFLLILLLSPFVSTSKLATLKLNNVTNLTALMVTITSFGYSILVPSLRVYYNDNVKELKKAIFFGSLIPLICYIGWGIAIMGIIPLNGHISLTTILSSKNPSSNLADTLSYMASMKSVTIFINIFTSICVVTSFLGVALCLTDFLADGLQLNKKTGGKVLIHLLTFLPPLIVVMFFPDIFVNALEYAGMYCLILLVLLPSMMVWRGRYKLNLADGYKVIGGKYLLSTLIIFSLFTITEAIKFL